MNTQKSFSEQITTEVTSWPGIEAGEGRRGEFAFKVGRREIGHLHGDRLAHFGFPGDVGAKLKKQGRVGPHVVAPDSPKLAARRIRDEADVQDVIELMRLNYDRIITNHGLPENPLEKQNIGMKNQHQHPDIMQANSNMVLISKWRVDDPANQEAAGDSAIGLWEHLDWPEGLLSHSVYLGIDGVTVLQYSQWTGEEAIDSFTEKNLQKRAKMAIDEVPGLERAEAVKYRHYKSMFSDPADWNRIPGCFIIVSFETDGPEWQHQFVDTLIETVESRKNPHHPGSIASHFHHSVDGKRVINYAEFVDEASHEEVVQTMLKDDDNIPRLIASMTGLKSMGFERYTLYRSEKNHQSNRQKHG